MKVVEKDRVIRGMLEDELRRCREMLESLEKSVQGLPKGVLSRRKKRYKVKVYSYYCLKYRNGSKVVNQHIPNSEVSEMRRMLDRREKIERERLGYKKRIAYLVKILGRGKQ